jgi:alkylhydroperoxidase/carboxymuconolactone decarboxylase family protein YurZ
VNDRFERGLDVYASQFGISRDEVLPWFAEHTGERFGIEAINAAADAWVNDCLDLRVRSLIVVAVLIAQGGVTLRLRGHVRWAIEHGASPEELEALATLLAVYVGFPKASEGIEIVRDELECIRGTESDDEVAP